MFWFWRETYPADDLAGRIGGKRTLTFVIPRENQADVGALAARLFAPGTTISTDDSDANNLLHLCFPVRRVNHQREYRAANGTTDNQAESYIARFRHMQIGQHHHFGLANLADYANEAACREDTRRWSDGEIFTDILTKCAHTPPRIATGAAIGKATPAARSVWRPDPPEVVKKPPPWASAQD